MNSHRLHKGLDPTIPPSPLAPRETPPSPWRWIVAATFLAGALLRLVDLGGQPIWHDEVYSRIFAAGHHSHEWAADLYAGHPVTAREIGAFQNIGVDTSLGDTILGLARDEPQHPPAYYVIARLWIDVFGDDLATLRRLSALFGLLTVAAGLWLAREVYHDEPAREAAPLFAALVAISPLVVAYGREAREYALWSGLVLASCAALLRATRTARLRHYAGFVIFTALGLYTSFSHVSVILAQGIFVAWQSRFRLTRASVSAAVAFVAAAILFLPWGILLIEHLDAFRASMAWASDIVVPRSEVVATLGLNLARPILDLASVANPLPIIAVVIVVTGLAVAIIDFGRTGPRATRRLVLLVFAVPLLMLVVPDLVWGGIRSFSTRYLFPSLLAMLLIVAHRLRTIEHPRLRHAVTAAVAIAALGSAIHAVATQVPWHRALSAGLPAVAHAIEAAPKPFVLGDRERHHPGNLHALATLVPPETPFLLLDFAARDALVADLQTRAARGDPWPPPSLPGDRTIFVYSPVPQLVTALEAARGAPLTRVYDDPHVSCWRLDASNPTDTR